MGDELEVTDEMRTMLRNSAVDVVLVAHPRPTGSDMDGLDPRRTPPPGERGASALAVCPIDAAQRRPA